MILQTGMRTDIPAFYSRWFANRLKEGFVLVRNPYNPENVTRYRISPDVVDLISFCTKNPAPMFEYMDLLKPYGQYWFVTITSYGRDVEPNVPPKEKVMADFRRLSDIVGINSIGWRYDPIFIDEKYTLERHISDFEKMAKYLAGYTEVCVISFIDLYKKVLRNFPQVSEVNYADRLSIGKAFVETGRKYGITIKPCAEGRELERYGADCSGCMTVQTYETALGMKLNAPKKKSLRSECSCLLGSDIGEYDTCGHLCRYCYANNDVQAVRRNMRNHNPDSPLLIGNLHTSDKIHDAKQESWIDNQLTLF
ncbi:MAG: DUF1848 domain-containing protein [Ruminococcus sp.]|nr:DUF1848 domain-containing protein [Ruminococcus sp.]